MRTGLTYLVVRNIDEKPISISGLCGVVVVQVRCVDSEQRQGAELGQKLDIHSCTRVSICIIQLDKCRRVK